MVAVASQGVPFAALPHAARAAMSWLALGAGAAMAVPVARPALWVAWSLLAACVFSLLLASVVGGSDGHAGPARAARASGRGLRRLRWLLVAGGLAAAAPAAAFEVATWNAGGLTAASLAELGAAADAWPRFTGGRLDVVAVQESKLGASSEVALPGFAALRKDVRRGTRGLVTFVRDDLVAVRDPRLEHDDSILAVLPAVEPPVWVLSVYRRPSALVVADGQFLAHIGNVSAAARRSRALLLVVGDLNARAFDGAPQAGGRFPRTSRAAEVAPPATVRLARWLRGQPELTVVSGAQVDARLAYTRARGADVSELDFVLANELAAARFGACTTENGAIGAFPAAPLTSSDHYPVRVAVRLSHAGVGRVARPAVRRVRWASADAAVADAYSALLARGLGARVAPLAGLPRFAGFGGSADRAAAAIVSEIEAAEDRAVGSAVAAPQVRGAGGFADRLLSAATLAARDEAELARRTLIVARAERQRAFVAGGSAVTGAPSLGVVAVLDAAAHAATTRARDLHSADIAAAAFDQLTAGGGGSSSNLARRVHAAVRSAIDRAPRRAGSTHEFDVLERPGGDDYLFGADMRAFLAASMARMHAVDAGDPRFCAATLRALEASHWRWVRHERDAECAASRARSADLQRWRAFDRRVAGGERPSDTEWRARCAADVTVGEVADAISAMAAGTAASPGDGVRPAALQHGGPALHASLAALFTAVLDTGQVPAVWTVGYVRWLPKGGSGSELDWLSFRGIVLTSVVGKTFERVMLARLSRWARCVGAIPDLQAGSNAPLGVLNQVHLVHGAAAARAVSGLSTWVVLVDITRAFPSTTRSLVWERLRSKGMGGAAVRAVDALFANTARLSVGGGVGYTDSVRREVGLPEGYVLSPLLFSLTVSELIDDLAASGLGLSVGGVWCGAVALVDDVALLATSRAEALAMLDTVALWCWRRRYLLSLGKCALLCAGPGCAAHLGARVAWRWSPPPPAAAEASLAWNFTVARAVKYLGVLVSTELTFDAHVEANARRAAGELAAARSAVAAFGGLRRVHALVAYVAYGRAYVEWAAPVYGVLSAAARGHLERLHESAMRLVAGVGGDSATFLLGELPVASRCVAAAARFAFDLATVAAAFPRRAAVQAALGGAGSVGAAIGDAVAACALAVPDVVGFVGRRAVDVAQLRRVRATWRTAVRRAVQAAARNALLAASPSAHALVGQAPVEAAWRREFVLHATVQDAPSTLLLRVLADEWELVPEVRARTADAVAVGVCDLCGAACAGDLAHVLLECPCAELARVRAAWIAEVEATLVDAALGAWWHDLPATLDGRGAAALGRLVDAPPSVARHVRASLTRAFARHIGAWWEQAGDGVVARLAVAG